MSSLSTFITASTQRLTDVTDTPRLDAELLIAHELGMPRSRMLAKIHDSIDVPGLEALLLRRLNHEPIAYILGTWEFFSLDFAVRPPILVPRPETEHLVEIALEFLKHRNIPNPRILDLCTGTGCVAIATAHNVVADPRMKVVAGLPTAPQPPTEGLQLFATDINPDALALTQENAARHNIPITTFLGDLFDALPADTQPFDLITCNPPYVEVGEWAQLSPVITKHEDPRALLSGDDGLDCLRRVIAQAPRWLKPGGMLAVEMDASQSIQVQSLFQQAGFVNVQTINDLSGRPRVASGTISFQEDIHK